MIFETVLGVLASIALGIFIVNIIVLNVNIAVKEKELDEVQRTLTHHIARHGVANKWSEMTIEMAFQKIDELRERIEEIEHDQT